ncbi:MAG: hypothetical protein J5490_05370, partial [Bacteroidales bacterium]|nr:hypothetical protein [Bacteroidales bacterium]
VWEGVEFGRGWSLGGGGVWEGVEFGRGWRREVVPGKPVAARGLVNGWMALAPDGMERSGRFFRHHLPSPGLDQL